MGRIVVLGSTNTDMVIKADRIPSPGETVLGGSFVMNPGGKGANQAVAAARLGGDVLFVGKVGADGFGREARSLFEKEGMELSLFTDPERPSGIALIMVDGRGQNCISVASGANGALSPEDIGPVRRVFETASLVLAQLEIPLETVALAARWAAACGVPVILNPAPARALPAALLASLSVITPNEGEAEALTGIRVGDGASARAAARALHGRGVRQAVITMGEQGAFFSSDGGEDGLVPAEPVEAVDATAAGDVFNGALAVALSEGKGLRDAVVFASGAAALSVTRMGARPSIPYRRELPPAAGPKGSR